ncbi:two-component sensor histidine kinase [Robertmurraya siralis]|uniref:histidine kinase n=1 Tax=Robertmurraya siralis TaxID=77777 RepID=A0A919WKP4_9BACI|nr:HAMP domain-containing sensor histidine kinase [Robertmurraya siralis]GIN63417.1 two-component sensor histidine kinase [Robertmurraya siralis]
MKRKVILYFMIIITLTLGLMLAIMSFALTKYYYQGIANTFENHVKAITPLWDKGNERLYGELQDYSEQIIKDYQYKGADLELLNLQGELLQSSTGFYEQITYNLNPDIVNFSTVYEEEKVEPSGEEFIAVYIPLVLEGQAIGVLRYGSSLANVHEMIERLMAYGFLVCAFVAATVFLVSLRLADSIVKPVNKIIDFTKEMSKGKFEKRIAEEFPHELGEMARTLNYMADEIVKTDQLKNEFISSISHELRTPLTGIKGWIETIQSSDDLTKEEEKFGLKMIEGESERLIELVEDLLDFSRYESDRMVLMPGPIEFDHLVQEAAAQLEKRAEEKNVQIKLECTPVTIFADRNKMKQVLLNLLDNAIKFSEAGTEIHILVIIKDESLFCSISDQGIGIKEEDLPFIAESFYKINNNIVGAGLGLAISRKIVEKHGGTIIFKSNYGKGTTVEVTLPLA